MISEYTRSHGNIIGFEFTGRLAESDYPELTRIADEAIATYGKIRILVHFHQFSGWTPSGFWRDFRFSREHADTIERFAVVGEDDWQKALIELAKPFTRAEVKYFPEAEKEEAWRWLESS
jgi:SpoIIAA-like